jgi:hypothetical protein
MRTRADRRKVDTSAPQKLRGGGRRARLTAVVVGCLALQACGSFGMGYYLPEGDPDRGREAFVWLGCHLCHGVEDLEAPPGGVFLGGRSVRVKTYGDLYTAITNPSHELARGYPRERVAREGQSIMADARLNEVMTVQELIDLVAFLYPQYEVVPPPIRTPWESYRPLEPGPPVNGVPER